MPIRLVTTDFGQKFRENDVKQRLTDTMIDRITKPGTYRDEARGLQLVVGKLGKKSWRVVAMVKGETIDATIGTHAEMPVAEARRRAAELIAGVGRQSSRLRRMTLGDAWALVEPTIDNSATHAVYAGAYQRLLAPHFANRNLVELVTNDAEDVISLHGRILRETGSPFLANQMTSTLAAIVKRLRTEHEPRLPQWSIRLPKAYAPASEPDLSDARLRTHFAAIEAEPNIRVQALNLAVAYTGARPATLLSLASARLDEAGWLCGLHGKVPTLPSAYRRRPGEVDLFATPQLRPLLELGFAPTYLVPGALPPRAMRKWYATVAHLTVGPILAEVLMSHSLGGMRQVYVRPQPDAIAEAARAVADAVDQQRRRLVP